MNPPTLGAQYLGQQRCCFTLWAPFKQSVSLRLLGPKPRLLPLSPGKRGYWQVTLEDVAPGQLYQFEVDGEPYPDPASQSQPQGLHGPSAVVDQRQFAWQDQAWSGYALQDLVIYELHVGTFTPEGTFEAMIPRLAELRELGITAIELMPVAQFPGERNWGYDGAAPFATQTSYGGVTGLKQLVNACHQADLAVILDVVYNHLGPEGNYLWHYGTYFTERYKTPWGAAINYDDVHSDGLRAYVLQNVRYWLETCHIDALRLDAVHAIYDFGAISIFQEMAQLLPSIPGPRRLLIAESDLNDPRIIRPLEQGGHGLDAQWSDDFHHALHALLTGEQDGYYQDFGDLEHLAKAYQRAFVYAWDYSQHRRRYHGAPAQGCASEQFVVCSQNHDQVGNRMMGDRLSQLISFEAQKLAAAATILSPYVPMLFMGEEYGETAPFQYFVSHGDPELIESVRQGRRAEFADFQGDGEAPDPQAEATFERSKLNWSLKQSGQHQQLWRFYQQLLRLRRQDPALGHLDRHCLEAMVYAPEQVLRLRRWHHDHEVLILLNFSEQAAEIEFTLHPGTWHLRLNSSDAAWGGAGQAQALPQMIPQNRDRPVTQQRLQLAPQSATVYSTTSAPA